MAKFSFNTFNKERLFTFDVSAIDAAHPQTPKERAKHDDRYTNLEELYKENGADKIYQIKAFYINNKTSFENSHGEKKAPVVALADIYVNAPVHQLDVIEDMMADPSAVKAINDGYAGFYIDTYTDKYSTTRYKMIFCDVDPSDFDDLEDGEIDQ